MDQLEEIIHADVFVESETVRTVTTGGGGISVNWISNVYVTGVDLTTLAKEASLAIVNNGVKKASKLIPHSTNL